MRFTTFYLFN